MIVAYKIKLIQDGELYYVVSREVFDDGSESLEHKTFESEEDARFGYEQTKHQLIRQKQRMAGYVSRIILEETL